MAEERPQRDVPQPETGAPPPPAPDLTAEPPAETGAPPPPAPDLTAEPPAETGAPPPPAPPPPAPAPAPDLTVEPPAGEAPGGVVGGATGTPGTDDASGVAAVADVAGAGEAAGPEGTGGPLVPAASGYRSRWEDVQAAFVDEPRAAVEDADQLVVAVIDEVTEALTRRREEVTSIWRDDPDASTEDLRRALQRYRAVFDNLLSL